MKYFVILFGFLVLISIFTINSAFALNQEQSDSEAYEFVLDRCINPVDFRVGHIFENATHYMDTMGCILFEKRMIKGSDNETADKRIIENLPNFLKSPLKQIKAGVTTDEIQCNESLILVTKYDGSPACVKPETIPRLMERNWIKDDAKQQCETFSGIWNKDFATCFDFSDEYDCKDMGGKPVSRSYTGEQPDYSKKSDSFACEFRK
jgi:hypothetical protein